MWTGRRKTTSMPSRSLPKEQGMTVSPQPRAPLLEQILTNSEASNCQQNLAQPPKGREPTPVKEAMLREWFLPGFLSVWTEADISEKLTALLLVPNQQTTPDART